MVPNKIKKQILIALMMIPSAFAFAQRSVGSGGIKVDDPLGGRFNDIADVIAQVLQFIIMPIAVVLVTIMIVFYGMKLVMSQGKPTEVAEAKKMIFWALIGGFVILGATGIASVISNTATELAS